LGHGVFGLEDLDQTSSIISSYLPSPYHLHHGPSPLARPHCSIASLTCNSRTASFVFNTIAIASTVGLVALQVHRDRLHHPRLSVAWLTQLNSYNCLSQTSALVGNFLGLIGGSVDVGFVSLTFVSSAQPLRLLFIPTENIFFSQTNFYIYALLFRYWRILSFIRLW